MNHDYTGSDCEIYKVRVPPKWSFVKIRNLLCSHGFPRFPLTGTDAISG